MLSRRQGGGSCHDLNWRLPDSLVGHGAGKELYPQTSGYERSVAHVAFAPDARLLATASSVDLRLWDARTATEIRSYNSEALRTSGDIVFSPNGKLLAAADAACVWEVDSGRKLYCQKQTDFSWIVAFSPDGKTLALAQRAAAPAAKKPVPDGKLVMVDLDTGRELMQWQAHAGAIDGLAFSRDGKRVASAGADGLFLWDAASGQLRQKLAGQQQRRLFLTASGELVSCSAAGLLCWWDMSSGMELRRRQTAPDDLRCMAFSTDGTFMAWVPADEPEAIDLCESATGAGRRRLHGHRGRVNSLSFSADGRTLASGSDDTTILIWKVGGGGRRDEQQAMP